MSEWKFNVIGTFVQNGEPVSPCSAIIESGDRSESSPFRFRGLGRGASANESGAFESTYFTEGSNTPIARPTTVSVYVRVAKGEWEPIVVNTAPDRAKAISDAEMHLNLGAVELPSGMTPYAQDA